MNCSETSQRSSAEATNDLPAELEMVSTALGSFRNSESSELNKNLDGDLETRFCVASFGFVS